MMSRCGRRESKASLTGTIAVTAMARTWPTEASNASRSTAGRLYTVKPASPLVMTGRDGPASSTSVRWSGNDPLLQRSVRDIVGRASAADARDQGRHFRPIASIFFGKAFAHEALFDAQFEQQRTGKQCEGQQAAPLAKRDGGAQDRQQQAGINRMADQAVRAGAYKLVILLDSDRAAPVAAKIMACPNGKSDAGGNHDQPEPIRAHRRWQKTLVEPGQPAIRPCQQRCGQHR